MSGRLIVRPHRPWRGRLLAVAGVVVVLLSGWGLFEYGRYRAGFDAAAAQHMLKNLTYENAVMQRNLQRLREEKTVLERGVQIDGQACKVLEATVNSLQAELADYKSDLTFYRGIVSPKEAQQGLRVEAFDIIANTAENSFHFKLVLAQVLKEERQAKGQALFEIEGLQDNQAVSLPQQKVLQDGNSAFAFNFKYFQNFEGILTLPEGFIPLRVVVKLEPGNKAEKLEKILDWPTEQS